ncbi:MAG: glycosyltransferase [Planctomycetes bacterium]|nr:glycosyltransferase [Planctomycetota bacterium]
MNILIIAYYFPPDSTSGAFRPLLFARHLWELGEHVTILTAREQDYHADQPRDPSLLAEVEPHLDIFRARVFRPLQTLIGLQTRSARPPRSCTQAKPPAGSAATAADPPRSSWRRRVKDLLLDCLSTPDRHLGWLPSALHVGRKLIKQRRIDVMYATGGPWTSLLIGAILKAWTKRPLLMDFRDPWVSNPYLQRKVRWLRALDAMLERRALKYADTIITNTEELAADFLERYPWLTKDSVVTIPNGFEGYSGKPAGARSGRLTLIHAGALYFSRNPRALLEAIVNVVAQQAIPQGELRLILLGELAIEDPALNALWENPIVQDVVEIVPRLPYREALAYQMASDVLCVIQPDFPLQVPRKLYEYMALRKPILGITNPGGATARTIQGLRLGMVVENRPAAIEGALKTLYAEWKRGFSDRPPPASCDRYRNANLAATLLEVMRKTCTASGRGACSPREHVGGGADGAARTDRERAG